MDRKELMKKLTHPRKSKPASQTRPEETQDGPRSEQDNSRTNEGRARTDKDSSRSRSTHGRSRSNQARSRSNQDISRSNPDKSRAEEEKPRSRQDSPKSTQDKQRTKQEKPRLNQEKRVETRDEIVKFDLNKVPKATLPFSNQNKLDTILYFFPRFRMCCCCWSLRTGCLLIGWTQVIGCVLVGCSQSLIALICFKKINLDDLFNNFPENINPAKTVSESTCNGVFVQPSTGAQGWRVASHKHKIEGYPAEGPTDLDGSPPGLHVFPPFSSFGSAEGRSGFTMRVVALFNLGDLVADDYCGGLSIGYASGEVIGFATGIMLLMAVSKDLLYLLRFWVYTMIIMLLPTITFYGIALYAMIEYRKDLPVIAVPSAIELATFVVLCYCTSIVKSYYYQRVEDLLGISPQEPILLQEQGEIAPHV